MTKDEAMYAFISKFRSHLHQFPRNPERDALLKKLAGNGVETKKITTLLLLLHFFSFPFALFLFYRYTRTGDPSSFLFINFSELKLNFFAGAPVTLYVDMMSQPCRAVVWFCLLSRIPFEIKGKTAFLKIKLSLRQITYFFEITH